MTKRSKKKEERKNEGRRKKKKKDVGERKKKKNNEEEEKRKNGEKADGPNQMANSLSTSRTCPEHGHFRMEFRKHRTSMNILISENIKRYSRALVNNNGSIKYIIISSFALRAIEIMMLCAVIIAKSFFWALTV